VSRVPARLLLGGCALGLLLAGCGTTVVETPPTSAPKQLTTTTEAVPSSTTNQLEELVDSALSLGDLIFDGDPGPSLTHIDAVWKAAMPTLQRTDSDLSLQLQHELLGLHTAVERTRPADADKAARNIENLVHIYLQRVPGS
jgi:hypothetical protein